MRPATWYSLAAIAQLILIAILGAVLAGRMRDRWAQPSNPAADTSVSDTSTSSSY